MAKYRQSKADRMDESLGMRNGPERDMKQSYKDRRDESMGMKKAKKSMPHKANYREKSSFDLKDNMQSGMVKNMPSTNEDYDVGRLKPEKCGSKGYPKEAWNYKY